MVSIRDAFIARPIAAAATARPAAAPLAAIAPTGAGQGGPAKVPAAIAPAGPGHPAAAVAPAPAPAAVPPAGGSATGVFITPQSLVNFPVAAAVVTGLWTLARVFGPWGRSYWTALALSLLIGTVIFLINVSDPSTKPKNGKDWTVAVFVGVINSLFICSSALGLLGASSQAGSSQPGSGTVGMLH